MNDALPDPKRSPNTKTIFFRWLKILIIIYSLTGIAVYYLQDKFLFHPKSLPYGYAYNFKDSFSEINIEVNKDEILNLVQFYPNTPNRKGTILYFHGNMENIAHYADAAEIFLKNGYEVLMPDYPGFGKTTGTLTEKALNDIADLAYKLARKRFQQDSIIIYGRSMGSGIAARLASRVDCKRLILETPYISIPELMSTYLPVYPFNSMSHFKLPTGQYLKDVTAPVTIFHGTQDHVIPYSHAQKLISSLKNGDQFITIDKGGHNNLGSFPEMQKAIDSLLQH